VSTSVADPGCLSRIPDPGSRIPDPKTATKERGERKLVVIPFFCSQKFHKIVKYFSFEMLKKKVWSIFKELSNFLPKKLSLSSQKYGFRIRDPRSGIRDPEKTYSRSRIRGSKKHRIPDPDPQH
jgi:hypothetical protein